GLHALGWEGFARLPSAWSVAALRREGVGMAPSGARCRRRGSVCGSRGRVARRLVRAGGAGEVCGMPMARLKSGIELCYDERGEGPALVLVMGIGAQLVLWPEDLCDMFASRGFRVIRFDHRDVGLSTKLHHLPVPSVARVLLSIV